MEIRTCEEYVLAKLARLEEEYDEAVDELAEARRDHAEKLSAVMEDIKRHRETIVWSSKERERLENELKDANERIRSLEATCSEFARENDRLKRKVRDGE